jgi:hypothetical protein
VFLVRPMQIHVGMVIRRACWLRSVVGLATLASSHILRCLGLIVIFRYPLPSLLDTTFPTMADHGCAKTQNPMRSRKRSCGDARVSAERCARSG